MKNMKKILGIFLSLTMLLTMIPAGMVSAADEDYQVAASEICFADIKAENANGQFNVISDLYLFTQYTAEDGKTYDVSWVSSNEEVISTSGTVADVTADTWVDIYAVVEDDETDATAKGGTMKICVKAPVATEDVLFFEDFEDFELTDGVYTFDDDDMYNSGSGPADTWHIERPGNRPDIPASENGTEFSVRDSVLDNEDLTVSGKTLRLDTVDSGNQRNSYLTNVFATTAPESGIITFSADIMASGSSSQFYFFPVWQKKTTQQIYFPYGNNSTGLENAFAAQKWYNVSTVYNVNTGVATGYVNGVEYQSAELELGDWINKIQMRLQAGSSYNSDYTYVDNIRVTKKTFDAETAALTAFNPINQSSAYKNSNYVNMNLVNTLTIGGTAYDVTYASDDTGVIAADGTVTPSDFISYVTVIPSITVDGVKLSAPSKTLIVLPMAANFGERLYEDFEDIGYITEAETGVEVGDIFNAAGAPVDSNSGWTVAAPANYTLSYADGNRWQIISDEANNVMRFKTVKDSKNVQLKKSIANPDIGDKAALCMRVKLVSGNMNFSTNFSGRLRPTDFRADFGGTNTTTDLSLSFNKDWHTYMFVYDSGIVESKNSKASAPISLYIDGEYVGTSWSTTTALPDAFAMMQWGAVAADSEVLVDDILLINFDAKELQLAGTTVAGGVLTTADVQYVSYESDLTGTKTIIAAAYNNQDELVDVSIIPNVAVNAIGYNEVAVNYTLPSNAVKYRLFLFESIDSVKPLALSKIYNIAE